MLIGYKKQLGKNMIFKLFHVKNDKSHYLDMIKLLSMYYQIIIK